MPRHIVRFHVPTIIATAAMVGGAAAAMAQVTPAAVAQPPLPVVAAGEDRVPADPALPPEVGETADGQQPGPDVLDPDETAADRDGPQVPLSLTPVDRWREDPTVAFASTDVELADFIWVARPVVVFADSPADPAFQRQVDLLLARADDLVRRDVVVITDTDPASMSDIRRTLRPRGFMLAVLGKDGGVKLRKPLPWDVRELGRAIDKMPIRLQELRDERNANQ